MTVSDTERLTTYANATDTEKRLSEAVADELGIAPTYTDERGVEWPLVQCVGQSGRDYAFWLGEYGALGTVTDAKEVWSTAHADSETMVEEDIGTVRDAALAAQDLEEAS
jgi:hypothetical protein